MSRLFQLFTALDITNKTRYKEWGRSRSVQDNFNNY